MELLRPTRLFSIFQKQIYGVHDVFRQIQLKMSSEQAVHSDVQKYYGETLTGTDSLLTNACCVGKSNLTPSQKKVMSIINEEITSRFYGCGSPVPPCLQGKTIVDLGCGTGVDVYIASYFAKETGRVIGIDMTPAQLEVAKRNCQEMTKKYGFSKPNVEFVQANIEKIPLQDNSVDVVISNCVVNLSPSKKQVFSQIRRILKPGGQLYFSDVYANRRINQNLRQDKVLWGECLSGALYVEDFRRIMDQLGFKDCRIISKSNITVNNEKVQKAVAGIKFYSITYRCFKLDDLEDRCEDYGQKVKYLGGIEEYQDQFALDNGHTFKKGESADVCGNTASMIKYSRFGKYFQVEERGEHQGLFDCSEGCPEKNGQGSKQNPCGVGTCC